MIALYVWFLWELLTGLRRHISNRPARGIILLLYKPLKPGSYFVRHVGCGAQPLLKAAGYLHHLHVSASHVWWSAGAFIRGLAHFAVHCERIVSVAAQVLRRKQQALRCLRRGERKEYATLSVCEFHFTVLRYGRGLNPQCQIPLL